MYEKSIFRFIIYMDDAVGFRHTSQKVRVESHSSCEWSRGKGDAQRR